ncbi:MAG: ribonuclease III [Elusimicrobia bacterium]|nr:ribonuclease III [Elusimicrobiota bacterium]MBP9127674.1 ribonuclease III [Elusimicrobiota bacterium]
MPRIDSSPLQRVARHVFKSPKLLEEALTHKSYAIERGSRVFNERLEFLGDSVLAAVVAHYLFKRYPDEDEGKLSKLKSQLVARPSLVVWAREIRLGDYLWMSDGEEATGGRERESLLANAFEALLGALFLDGGFSVAQRFVVRLLSKKKRIIETDYKSKLQEIIQKRYKLPPAYTLKEQKGPDHNRTFVMHVFVRRRLLGAGEGRSKKEAEQAAAWEGLKKIRAHRLAPRIDPLRMAEDNAVAVPAPRRSART